MLVNNVNACVFASAFKSIPVAAKIEKSSTFDCINLTESLKSVKNKLAILGDDRKKAEAKVNANKLSLEEIKSISEKYGKNAIVRLKNGKFKYGYGSNTFKNRLFAIRYALECLDVVDKFKTGGATVSALDSDKILKRRINDGEHKLQSLREEIGLLESNLDITHQINMTPEEKIASENAKVREIFSAIYQSDAGCKALNTEARVRAANKTSQERLEGKDVVAEYKMAHGDDVFNEENEAVKVAIEAYCKELPRLVNISADALYTPTSNNITTYRGQKMTKGGINRLINQALRDKSNHIKTVYKPEHFFSTSLYDIAALKLSKKSQAQAHVNVMFEVKGNSSHALTVPNGLAFGNHEGERFYSPHANFKVRGIYMMPSTNIYRIVLQEVAKADGVRLLPY